MRPSLLPEDKVIQPAKLRSNDRNAIPQVV